MKLKLPASARIHKHETLGSVLSLSTKHSSAEIALHGATVISFVNKDPESRPLFWLSPKASGASGKAIRGGVPLCAPWFGPHPTASTAPAHGIVRTGEWELLRVEECEDESQCATFSMDLPRDTGKGWNHDARAEFVVTIGKTLKMELSIRNTGSEPFMLSEAMHNYFAVSDVRNVSVDGLDNCEYLDFSGDGKRHSHGLGPLTLSGEAAHMFYTGKPVKIVDREWAREISIRGWGAASTVVWNPWDRTASTMSDVGGEWPRFICVENANIPDVSVLLAPNTSHHMGTEIAIAAL
ncbi:MAG: D-hexose-6-phosphate mutarotase [Opitutales bacterium]|nr:D-hexose-6-phosphate mutarotase [Opitutales bacterium]